MLTEVKTEVKTLEINPTPFFTPPLIKGDGFLSGHGPMVQVSTKLSIRNARELWATVYMHEKATQNKLTESEGTAEYLVYRDVENMRILRILSDLNSFTSFSNGTEAVDIINMPLGELVKKYECVNERNNSDATIRTGVRVYFNPIKLEIEPISSVIKTINVDPTPKFFPFLVNGDSSLRSLKPRIDVFASIFIHNQCEIWAKLWMHAKGTSTSRIEELGATKYLIYRNDKPIAELISTSYSQASYTDAELKKDVELFLGDDELVSLFICTSENDEVNKGYKTGMIVHFNPIVFREA